MAGSSLSFHWTDSVPGPCRALLRPAAGILLAMALWTGAGTAAENGIKSGELRVRITLDGAGGVSTPELRRAAASSLAVLEKNPEALWAADDAAFQMVEACRRRGFAFARADYAVSREPDPPEAHFTVHPGPRVGVAALTFSGDPALPVDELRRFFPMRPAGVWGRAWFAAEEVRQSVSRLRDYYHARGYRDVRIPEPQYDFTPDHTAVAVGIRIEAGARYRLTEVRLEGGAEEAALPLAEAARGWIGEPYTRAHVRELLERLEEIHRNLGYPDAVAESRARSEPSGDTTLTAAVTPGPRVTVERVVVRGARDVSPAFIRGLVPLTAGELFRADRARAGFRNLYATGVFERVEVRLAADQTGPRRDLVVEVTERRGGEFYLQPGWGSYEQFRFQAGWLRRNPWGFGRTLRAEAGVSFKTYHLEAGLSSPRALGLDAQSDLPVFLRYRREPSFWRRQLGAVPSLSLPLSEAWSLNLGYEIRSEVLGDVNVETETVYVVAGARAQAGYDTRNDPFWPTRGLQARISVELSDPWLGGDTDLTRVGAAFRAYLSPAPGVVAALRYDAGLVWPHRGGLAVPVAERFFNGGENSVRSYGEDQIGPRDRADRPAGGLAANTAALELRWRFWDNFAAAVFADWGNVAPGDRVGEALAAWWSGGRAGVGAGLRYLLPVGPLRLDAAVDPASLGGGPTQYAVHFSVGTAF